MAHDQPAPLKSVAEAAAFVGVTIGYLNKLRVTGGGPVFVKLGRRIQYDLRDLQAWISMNRRTSTSDAGGRAPDAGSDSIGAASHEG